MADKIAIEAGDANILYKVTSGGIRFKVRTEGLGPEIILASSDKPYKPLYKIVIGNESKVRNYNEEREVKYSTNLSELQEAKEFSLTWHSNKIKLNLEGEKEPALVYDRIYSEPVIGFVRFKPFSKRGVAVEWIIETSPISLPSVPLKRFDASLQWLPLNYGKLPPNAMIGGFENELTYIARAEHNNSLCPGIYKPSTGLAHIPWGHREHTKSDFEILCGFNAKWEKTETNQIPLNAFIGGYSEVHQEPLYIGRALVEGMLICGKIHVRYHLCYLPFKGQEIELSSFEVLVLPERELPQAYICSS